MTRKRDTGTTAATVSPPLPTGGGMPRWGEPLDQTYPAQRVDYVVDGSYAGVVMAGAAMFAPAVHAGSRSCPTCRCYKDGNATMTASDALRALASALGRDVSLDCPACT